MISQYMLEGLKLQKQYPDQEGDVLGGTVNFKLKAPSGLHGNFVTQGMQMDCKRLTTITNL